MTKERAAKEKEIQVLLRGEALYYSSGIETLIDSIIILGNGDNPEYEGFNFKSKLFEKVKLATEVLQRTLPDIYAENESVFVELRSLTFRHQMAHSEIVFDEDFNGFTVYENTDSAKDAAKTETRYTMEQANEEIKRLKDLDDKLSSIVVAVLHRFQTNTGVILFPLTGQV